MPRFFISEKGAGVPGGASAPEDTVTLTGGDAAHILKSLRMKAGETLTLCDGRGTEYVCELAGEDGAGGAVCRVLSRAPTACEPSVEAILVQSLPKGDKMELIVQKAVELGAAAVWPVQTARSVVRLEDGKAEKKRARWQKIADEAAGQSGRGILPAVAPVRSWKELLAALEPLGSNVVVLYEGGGEPLASLLARERRRVILAVGPEGGFEPAEIEALVALGARRATLGPRILRCETAPLAALAVTMAMTGNME